MLTYIEAKSFVQDAIYNGTGKIRNQYDEKYCTGTMAKDLWNDTTFTYGIEYGLLIALDKIYGNIDFIEKIK